MPLVVVPLGGEPIERVGDGPVPVARRMLVGALDPFRAAVRPVLERLGPLPEELVLALVLGERRRPAELARRFRGPSAFRSGSKGERVRVAGD